MSTMGLDGSKWLVEKEDDVISWASSLSEVHSEENGIRDQDSEISDYEAEAIWQAEQTEKEHRDLIDEYNIQIPDKQEWVASWFERNKKDYEPWSSSRVSFTYQVNLYGYYKKKKRMGGYGVIFRDPGGKPINASVYSSKGGSYLYYLLKGLRKGLKLAASYDGLDDGILVRCNSDRLVRILDGIFEPSKCRHHGLRHRPSRYRRKKICKRCTKRLFPDVERRKFKRLYRIIKDVMRMTEGTKFNKPKSDYIFDITDMERSDGNEAAYYLAKHFKNKSEIKPREFPPKLREILWKDAYEGVMAYSETSWMWPTHQKLRNA